MPAYKSHTVIEVARGIKAFVGLDLGLTRGAVPVGHEKKPEGGQGGRDQGRIRQLRERLSDSKQQIGVMREQLRTNGLEIARLRELNQQQLAESKRRIAELDRQLYETTSGREIGQQNGHSGQGPISKDATAALYLDMMKRALKDSIYGDKRPPQGTHWPAVAHTMIGHESLDLLQSCVEDVLEKGVPGDLIETGVWRGGTTIFMRAILKAYGVTDRTVWVADSFEGLPPPDAEQYPHDAGDKSHTFDELAISLEQVKANFQRYDLLDGQVRFLKGWFSDTLPEAPIEKLAIARLDGDMYESTMDALNNLYPKLSVGGYLIVDDYGAVPACRQAVHDYREEHGIDEEIVSIDWTGVYWQRVR